MKFSIDITKVDIIDWHTWLDDNAPYWSVVSVEYDSEDHAFSGDSARETVEWLWKQFSTFAGVAMIKGRIIYDIPNANDLMLTRLTWPVTPLPEYGQQ